MRIQVAVACLLAATGSPIAGATDLFPLREGVVREYEYSIIGYGSGTYSTYFSGTAEVGGDTTRLLHYAGGVDDGLINYWSETPEGQKLNHGYQDDTYATHYSPPVLMIDTLLFVGKIWEVDSRDSDSLEARFHFEVTAFGEVAVPAGTLQAFTIRETVEYPEGTPPERVRNHFRRIPGLPSISQYVMHFSYADGIGLILFTVGSRTDRLLSIHTTAVQEQDWARTRLLSSPNPLERGGKIEFTLPQSGLVRIDVFDVVGRRVGIVLDELRSRGRHELRWSGESSLGRSFASGVYFLRLETRSGVEVQKLAILE